MLIIGGAAATSSAILARSWPRIHWDEVVDVVIVGFGTAGAVGAIEASDNGASVTILEKMPIGGGTTVMSGGVIYASETPIQRGAGVTDSAGEMYSYLMATGKGLNRPELVRLFAKQSGENIEWLIEQGVNVLPYVLNSGCERHPEYACITPPKRRAHLVKGMGEGLFKTLEKSVEERGIEVLLETPVTDLITEGREVIGVIAQSAWGETSIRAKRGVILATGGFMYNKEMLLRYCQKGYRSLPEGNPGDEGDGIRMGRELGADLWAMTETAGLPAVSIPGQNLARPLVVNYYHFPCILVNQAGRRFVNEGDYYEFVNDALIELEGGPPAYVIFDESVRMQAKDKIVKYFSSDLKKEIEEGLVIQASTVENLAVRVGIDPTRLKKTFDQHNAYSRTGRDLDFGKTEEMGLMPLDASPFYAIQVYPGIIATTGGLKINVNAQVLDVGGNAIPRLYAAGRTEGGVIGRVFPGSGITLQDAICWGRIAGRHAASRRV